MYKTSAVIMPIKYCAIFYIFFVEIDQIKTDISLISDNQKDLNVQLTILTDKLTTLQEQVSHFIQYQSTSQMLMPPQYTPSGPSPYAPSPYAYAPSPSPYALSPSPYAPSPSPYVPSLLSPHHYASTSQSPGTLPQQSSSQQADSVSQKLQEPLDIVFKQRAGFKEPLSDDAIPNDKLLPSEVVLQKYEHKLLSRGKIGELAVKLSKEAFFGEDVMRQCTVMGQRDRAGLPTKTLTSLKKLLFGLDHFRECWTNPALFEIHWAKCVEAINHCCKGLRR